MKWRKLLDSSS